MEKVRLSVDIIVSPKEIRRCLAMVTGESLTDEEIQKQFVDRGNIDVLDKLSGQFNETEKIQFILAFIAVMHATNLEEE